MKTYADLTDEQLLQLYRLAADRPSTQWSELRRNYTTDRKLTALFHDNMGIYLNNQNGDIWLSGYERVHNLYAVVDLCRSWGLSYKAHPQHPH